MASSLYFTMSGRPGARHPCVLRVWGARGLGNLVFYGVRAPRGAKPTYFAGLSRPGARKPRIILGLGRETLRSRYLGPGTAWHGLARTGTDWGGKLHPAPVRPLSLRSSEGFGYTRRAGGRRIFTNFFH